MCSRGVLVEPEQGRAAHAWANGALQQIEDALGLEVVQARFLECRSNLGVAGHVRRRLFVGFESLPQCLRVLYLVQDQRGEQPVVVLRGRLDQRSADDVALKQGEDLGFLARRLGVLANVDTYGMSVEFLRPNISTFRRSTPGVEGMSASQ